MSLRWWSDVLAPGGELRPGSAPGNEETYVALPGKGAPSMMVDVAAGDAVATLLGRTGAATASHIRVLRKLAGRAASIDALRHRLPNLVHVHAGPAGTLREELGDRLGADVVLSATSGPLRPNRKPVIRALGADGHPIAFVKVGWDAATAAMVNNEATALASMVDLPCSEVIAPKVLDHDCWQGLELLVTEPLPIDESHTTDTDIRAEVDAIAAIAAHPGRRSEPLASGSFWRRLHDRLPDARHLLDAVVTQAADPVVGIGGFHGDWSPWNVRRAQNRGWLYVWDWERYGVDVPVGLDLVHYLFQVRRFVESRPLDEAVELVKTEAAELLGALEVGAEHAELLVQVELLETLARTTESGFADELSQRRGELLAAVERTLDPDILAAASDRAGLAGAPGRNRS